MDAKTPRCVGSRWLLVLVVLASTAVGCQSMAVADRQTGVGNHWTKRLPGCPCLQPQVTAFGDGWAVDRTSSLREHPGASACFRSYPPVATVVGRSGQQCCYDRAAALVTSGSAAGTPDRATSCRGETTDGRMKVRLLGLVNHVVKDVWPWARLHRSWRSYHSRWPPDNANACPVLHVEVHEYGAAVAWKEVSEPSGVEPAPLKVTSQLEQSETPAEPVWEHTDAGLGCEPW